MESHNIECMSEPGCTIAFSSDLWILGVRRDKLRNMNRAFRPWRDA
jgi:hypothetical protein